MQVEVITCMYNEEFLAPFFLSHYSWADKITVLLDTATSDRTGEILCADLGVSIIPFLMPDGMDDGEKSRQISQNYSQSTADWVIIADTDEFIFIGKDDLAKIDDQYNVAAVALHSVYRHRTEADLDPTRPIKEQRRHGYMDPLYIKPSIARGGLDISWGPGHHEINWARNQYPAAFIGAHWANADPCFCVQRRIRGRRDRQSPTNYMYGWSTQNHYITEADVLAECSEHEIDPRIERFCI
jgi:hypothetical protein